MDIPATVLEGAFTELLPASAKLIRRLRAESSVRKLTWSHVAIIARLDRHGPTTVSELARAECYTSQAMGISLAELEQAGLVERQRHPRDGRQVIFALTPDGVQARRQIGVAQREWLAEATGKLSPSEQKLLLDAIPLISKIAES